MKNRRKIILSTAVSITSTSSLWTKPVINSVILPVHAATTEASAVEEETPVAATTAPTLPTTSVSPREVFARQFNNGDGLFGINSALRVVVENGTFSIEFYSDAAESDLTPFIERGSSTELNVSTLLNRFVCSNDGSETPTSGMSSLTLSNHIPGASIDISNGFQTLNLPLDSGAPALTCPILG